MRSVTKPKAFCWLCLFYNQISTKIMLTNHTCTKSKGKKHLKNKQAFKSINSASTFWPSPVRSWTLSLVWKSFSKVCLACVSLERELLLRHPHWSIWELLVGLLHIKRAFPKRPHDCFNRALNLKFNLLAIFIISFYMIYFLKEPVKSLYWVKDRLEFVDAKSLQRKICKQKI